MANPRSRISLLDAEPDLAALMSAEEQAAARNVSVPVIRVGRGPLDLAAVLTEPNAFGALVLDGMLFSHHRIGDHTSLRLLGPGDLLAAPGAWRSPVLPESALSAAAPTTVALLATEVLLFARRCPRILAGFHVKLAEQSERLAAQLTICQFSRVDQRLLAIMWLLAESWGQVTSSGTRLPLNLTHDALGALVGARRPTVTLALGELVERGAIVRQERGWLLLEAPVEAPPAPPSLPDHAVIVDEPESAWRSPVQAPPTTTEVHDQLLDTIARLRADHVASRDRVRRRLAELASSRSRNSETRRRIADERVRRREVPS